MKTAKRNLTLSVPVALIQQLKVRAAERNMSLNASIRQALEQTLRFDRDYIAAGERILAASEKSLYKMPKKRWTRVKLYQR